MKTIDLTTGQHSLSELLALARSEAVLIHSASGEDFVLEHADEFDTEVAALGASEKFLSLLKERSRETGDIPINRIREKRGI